MMLLALRSFVYDMDFRPNLGTKQATLKNKRTYHMAIAFKMFIVALAGYWVFIWDPDIESFSSESEKYPWIECLYHANYKY